MTDTTLSITRGDGTVVAFPAGSARGIQCDVSQTGAGELRRTINGRLIDMTRPVLRKYTISLSADGVVLPDLRGLWRGQKVTVAPPITWTASIPAGASSATLERTARVGAWSLRKVATWAPVTGATLSVDGRIVTLADPAAEALLLEYQPVLDCLVTSVSISGDEWEATATWSIEMEEA